jgi:predicted metal-binding protein
MIHEPGNLPSSLARAPGGVSRSPRLFSLTGKRAHHAPLRHSAGRTMTVSIELQEAPLPPHEQQAAPMRLYVCTTCRDAEDGGGDPSVRAGARLYAALLAEPSDPAITIIPVECLSVCTRTCAVSFTAPGKWTYVYGDVPAATGAPVILEGARLYARAEEGLIPWKQRPAALKKGVIARVPPQPEVP